MLEQGIHVKENCHMQPCSMFSNHQKGPPVGCVTKTFPEPLSVGALNTCHKWFNQVALGKGSQARIALG